MAAREPAESVHIHWSRGYWARRLGHVATTLTHKTSSRRNKLSRRALGRLLLRPPVARLFTLGDATPMPPVGAAAGATDATGSGLQLTYVLTTPPGRA
jgi:hypothetical protein